MFVFLVRTWLCRDYEIHRCICSLALSRFGDLGDLGSLESLGISATSLTALAGQG